MTLPARTYLYAPGASPRLMHKALVTGADAVILDLEDAVAPAVKAEARVNVASLLEQSPDSPAAIFVRPNRAGPGYDLDDLRAVVRPGLAGLRLPKAEPSAVSALLDVLGDIERDAGLLAGSVTLEPLIESAAGAAEVAVLARMSRVARLALGGADLAADLGVPPDSPVIDHVGVQLVVHSRAGGLPAPVDRVHTAIGDLDGLGAAVERAVQFGFGAKSVIHPAQIGVVHRGLAPTAGEVEWARGVIAGVEAAPVNQAALVVDGGFVDAAVVARAERVLDRHRRG